MTYFTSRRIIIYGSLFSSALGQPNGLTAPLLATLSTCSKNLLIGSTTGPAVFYLSSGTEYRYLETDK